jgi:hypothetical protein
VIQDYIDVDADPDIISLPILHPEMINIAMDEPTKEDTKLQSVEHSDYNSITFQEDSYYYLQALQVLN